MSSLGSTPGTECPECGRLRRELDAALARIAALEAQVRELLAQLGRNSSNSSLPPSADPPGAPRPVVKPPTGRTTGRAARPSRTPSPPPPARSGQSDRPLPAHDLRRLPRPLPAEPGPADPEPTWHQVAELPELAAVITEHRGHARPAPVVATSIGARSPRRSAPMSSGRGWPR